ncbi:tetratricopeptide repeat protein [Aliikangiella sp. IMCC44653]
MSVVNKVLRDLQNQPSTTSQLEFLTADSNTQSHQAIKGLLIGISLAVAIFLTYQLLLKPVNSTNDLVVEGGQTAVLIAPQKQLASVSESEPEPEPEPEPNSAPRLERQVQPTTQPITQTKTQPSLVNQVQPNTSLANANQEAPELPAETNKNQNSLKVKPVDQPSQIAQPVNSNKPTVDNSGQTNTVAKAATSQPQVKTNNSERTQPVKTTSKATSLHKALHRIQLNATQNNQAQTYNALNLLSQQNPDFHPARLALINLCWEMSACLVEQKLNQAVSLFPKDSAYQQLLARFYFEKQRFQQAEKVLEELTPNDPRYLQLLQTRALARQQLGKHQLAIQDYATLLNQDASRGDILLAVGISLEAIGKLAEAQRSFKNALTDRRLSAPQRQFALNKLNSYQG